MRAISLTATRATHCATEKQASAHVGGLYIETHGKDYTIYLNTGSAKGFEMAIDVEGAKPPVQTKGETESVSANSKPPAALPAPSSEPPKKPGGGKPTLRRIK